MQSLKLDPKEFEKLRLKKTATIRKGRKNLELGLLQFNELDSTNCEIVKVVSVTYCKLKDAKIDVLKKDGFKNYHLAIVGLLKYYPDIIPDDEVTIVEFEIE